MAKDRFSNQKRSVYDKKFRYGLDPIVERKSPKAPINEKHAKRLQWLKSYTLTEWEKGFVKDVLDRKVALTQAQIRTIKKIEERYKATDAHKAQHNSNDLRKQKIILLQTQ